MNTIERIMDAIDKASEPDVMLKAEAIEFLDQIIMEIESRLEALREEIANE